MTAIHMASAKITEEQTANMRRLLPYIAYTRNARITIERVNDCNTVERGKTTHHG